MWASALVLGLVLGHAPPAHGQTCGAAGGDNRPKAAEAACTEADVASHPSTEPPTATQNSIDLVTGNKYLHARDAQWPGGLRVDRHYNSRNGFVGALGPGWTHGFETVLVRSHGRAQRSHRALWELQVIQADGRRLVFRGMREPTKDKHVIRFRAVDPSYGSVSQSPRAPDEARFEWRWRDGRRLVFDRDGRLRTIATPDGDRLTLAYARDSARLAQVRSVAGLAIGFEYHDEPAARAPGAYPERLAAIVQPDGTRIRYRYDAQGQLAEVEHPDAARERYHYEDATTLHALTRVTDGEGRARGVYAYDASGRAVASARGGGVEAIALAYRVPARVGEPGETVVDSASGRTRYRWRYLPHTHQAALIAAEGAGCTACPGTGFTRRYDAAFRLVEERHAGVGVSRRTYDATGRLASIGSDGAPGGPVRIRYRSDDPEAPVIAIERPSRAPGRTHVVRFVHDDDGRLLSRVESGWAPDLGALDADLRARRWLPIRRTLHLHYVAGGVAAGRLATIDGPLPGDADRVRLDYDAAGHVVAVQYPEGLVERRLRDRFGRLRGWVEVTGVEVLLERDAGGHVVAITRAGVRSSVQALPAERAARIRSDAHGTVRLVFDEAERLSEIVDPLGRTLSLERDGESRLQRVHLHEPGVAEPTIDLEGPALNPRPAPDDAWTRDGASRRATADGRIVWTTSTGAQTTWLHDDFGRRVGEASPERGLTVYRLDEAGRRTAIADGAGRVSLVRRDALGRVLARGTPAQPLEVQYRWRGALLAWVSDPQRTVAWLHDRQAREVAQAVLIGPRAQGPSAATLYVVATHYDAAGRVAGKRLPNGDGLGFGYGADGSLSAIVHRVAPERLRPGPMRTAHGFATVIARDIEWLPFADGAGGLRGLRTGHGTDLRIAHDRLGRVTAVEHGVVPGTPGAAPNLPRVALAYDAHGRVAAIRRGESHEAYVHDAAGRLVGAAMPGRVEGYAYDANGQRRARVVRDPRATPPGDEDGGWRVEHYRYDATAALVRVEASGPVGDGARPRVHVAVGRDGRPQSAWLADGRRWRFAYGVDGLRVARDEQGDATASRRYLYDDGWLAGEADASGRLLAWTVRIAGRPVAQLRFDTDEAVEVTWLHADQAGLVQAATDPSRRVRWQHAYTPFGERLPVPGSAARGQPDAGLASHLLFPGQVFDEPTGLADNGQRTYVPRLGRFTAPDPAGVAAGPNLYAYAGSSPLDHVDPTGLFETDIHYYMTFFLAMSAGLDYRAARTVALADQYIDDNPLTRPLDPTSLRTTVASIRTNQAALLRYHFTLSEVDPATGRVTTPRDTSIAQPISPQLDALFSASLAASTRCARFQFLGEFLHAFMDTFSHRDVSNRPYDPLLELGSTTAGGEPSGLGLGHGLDGHHPDYTYDHVQLIAMPTPSGVHVEQVDWAVNSARTLEMEREVFAVLRNLGDPARARSWEEIEPLLVRFNAIRENEAGASSVPLAFARKIALLDDALTRMGYAAPGANGATRRIDLAGADGYTVPAGAQARDTNLRDAAGRPLRPADYPGTLLPGGG